MRDLSRPGRERSVEEREVLSSVAVGDIYRVSVCGLRLRHSQVISLNTPMPACPEGGREIWLFHGGVLGVVVWNLGVSPRSSFMRVVVSDVLNGGNDRGRSH